MEDFRFLNYSTEYSCNGQFKKEMSKEPCFGYVFINTSTRCISEHYEVILYSGLKYVQKTKNSNACLFTRQQIRNHLKQAQGIYPFNFRIKEIKDWKGYTTFKVYLNLKDVPGTFHRYLLTWLRYIYEYPYNMIILDAYKLKKEPEFKFTSIANLFNLTLGCFCDFIREIHQIPRNQISKVISKKDLRKKIEQIKNLNNIYDRLKKKKEENTIPKTIKDFNVKDLEYWITDGFFEEYRKPIYMNVYKQIIKKK